MKKVIRIPVFGEAFRRASVFIALALTIISFNSALAAPLLIAPFDNPTFSTADAQGAWIPEVAAWTGATAISAGDSGGWGNEHAMVISCNTAGVADRCNSDHAFSSPTDFSVYKEFQLEIFVPNPDAIGPVSLYIESAPQWQKYYLNSFPTKRGWQILTFRIQDFSLGGLGGGGAQPSNWEQISKIRLTLWEGTNTDTGNNDIAIRAFRAVPRSAVALVKDFPSGNNIYDQTSKLLTDAYIAHEIISVADIERGYLKAAKMVILPNNRGLPDTVLTILENYVAAGGRIMANHSIDVRVQSLLGVTVGAYTPGPPGQFASFQFFDPIIRNLPSLVLQNSWATMQVVTGNPLRNPRVIANWNDYNGAAGPPTWIASDTGLYMSHVLLNDDATTKSKMLLSLLSHYLPQQGPESSSTSIADIGRVGKYTDYGEAVAGIRAGEAQLPSGRVAQVEAALTNAEALRNSALQAQNEARYADAVEHAKQSRPFMREAYILGQAAGSASEFRAVWSDTGAGPYPGDWARSIGLLANNGFNAVFPNVATAGIADYASNYLPRSASFAAFGDQLSAVVTAAHAAGIKVHAWDITWGMQGAPQSWIDALGSDRLMQEVSDASGQLLLQPLANPNWLSPCDDQNRALIKNALIEMASNYEIDGLHLDYIRTSGGTTPYELSCKARFEAETGNLVANWPTDVWTGALRIAYNAWKPTIITSFVKEVHDALIPVNAAKLRRGQPRVILSAAVSSDPKAGRDANAQDWPQWIAQGAIDVLHPMNYMTDLKEFNYALANQAAEIANRVPFYPGIGISGVLSNDEMIARSIATRGDNPNGINTGGFIHYSFVVGDFATGFLPAYGSGMTSNKTAQATDLAITASTGAGPALSGNPFTYTLTITNQGPDTATGVVLNDWLPAGVSLDFVAMSQGSCTTGANIRCDIGSLSNGVGATITFTVTAATDGEYRNEASVTGDGTDPRTLDNAATATATVVTLDLVPTVLTVTPSGTTLVINDAVSNQGSGTAGTFDIAYYLSSDATYQAGTDILLCGRSVTSLPAGTSNPASGTTTSTCAVPSVGAGSYYVIEVVDSGASVIESNESNNTWATAIAINGIDLAPSAVSATRSGTTKILMNETVTNQGNTKAGSFAIRYFLSTDTRYDVGDLPLASSSSGTGTCGRNPSSLGAGQSIRVSNKTCYKPRSAMAGVPYYVLVLDDANNMVSEYNEANNVGVSTTTLRW